MMASAVATASTASPSAVRTRGGPRAHLDAVDMGIHHAVSGARASTIAQSSSLKATVTGVSGWA